LRHLFAAHFAAGEDKRPDSVAKERFLLELAVANSCVLRQGDPAPLPDESKPDLIGRTPGKVIRCPLDRCACSAQGFVEVS
jgi:hypothetical protein